MSPFSMILLGGATVVAIGVWLIARWMARRRERTINCPQRLFGELCSKHRLSIRQRRLIAGLAQRHQLEHPAVVFVDPRLWEPDQASPSRRRTDAELNQLRDLVFHTSEPARESK